MNKKGFVTKSEEKGSDKLPSTGRAYYKTFLLLQIEHPLTQAWDQICFRFWNI